MEGPYPQNLAIITLILALLSHATRAQHVCVYCRGASEPPDPTAIRIACARNATQNITCPDTGVLPNCDDTSLFQPVGRDLPDGCNVLRQVNATTPVPGQLQVVRVQVENYECYDSVLFQNVRWGLRAVVMDPSCPDQGSIWTECSFSAPLCQSRGGVRQVNVGPFVAAGEPSTAPVAGAPAQEGAVRELPPVMGVPGMEQQVVLPVVPPAPEPLTEMPVATIVPQPQTTLPAGTGQ